MLIFIEDFFYEYLVSIYFFIDIIFSFRFSFLRFLARIMYLSSISEFLILPFFRLLKLNNQISSFKDYLFRLRVKFLIFQVIFDSNTSRYVFDIGNDVLFVTRLIVA